MTQKTTLPGVFTGALVSALPKFIHAAPVTSGLIRRYAAAALDSSAVGSAVGSLADLTGSAFPLYQIDPALQPTVRQSGIIRYLEFDGDFMAAGTTANAPVTFAIVGKYRTASNAGNWPIAQTDPGGKGAYSRGATGAMASFGSVVLTGGGDPGTGWHVFLATFDGANSVVRVDSTEVTGNAGTTTLGTSFTVGRGTDNLPGVMVDIAEILIWSKSMTLTERNKVAADLKAVYGF